MTFWLYAMGKENGGWYGLSYAQKSILLPGSDASSSMQSRYGLTYVFE